MSVSHTQSLSTIPGHSKHARVSQLFLGKRPSKRQGTLFFSPLPPLYSHVVITDKTHGPFPLNRVQRKHGLATGRNHKPVPFLRLTPPCLIFSLPLAQSSASHLLVVFSLSCVANCISFTPPTKTPHYHPNYVTLKTCTWPWHLILPPPYGQCCSPLTLPQCNLYLALDFYLTPTPWPMLFTLTPPQRILVSHLTPTP